MIERDRHQNVNDALCHAGPTRIDLLKGTQGIIGEVSRRDPHPEEAARRPSRRMAAAFVRRAPFETPCFARLLRVRRQRDMMSSDESNALHFASADLAAELRRWLSHLGAERRMSPKTVEAYERDVRQFLSFLTEHTGGSVSLKALAGIEPRDVRAFMAARRGDGIGSRSLMRSLAG